MQSRDYATDYPAIAANHPEMIDQMADYERRVNDGSIPMNDAHGHTNTVTHPEVWLHSKLDYFRSTGGIKPNDHTHTTPYVGGWESLTNGRWASGGVGAQSSFPHRVN